MDRFDISVAIFIAWAVILVSIPFILGGPNKTPSNPIPAPALYCEIDGIKLYRVKDERGDWIYFNEKSTKTD